MIRINNICLAPGEKDIKKAIAQKIKIDKHDILNFKIVRKSLDARKKNKIHFNYIIDISTINEAELLRDKNLDLSAAPQPFFYEIKKCNSIKRPVVVGFGPAGMFAALVLSISGLRPIVLERGSDVDERCRKVAEFHNSGILDTECNVQFGEGGAGTFSDGKLTTGKKDKRISFVLEEFYKAGAPENILYDAKPHIGTDILTGVVKELRKKIIENGGEIRFNERLKDIKINNNRVCSVVVQTASNEYNIDCNTLVLAVGHSARDTFEMLQSKEIPMQRKAFSMGVRIEHKQEMIDKAQYGPFAGKNGMPPADYKLVCHLADRSVYTFCMCPGGEVIASSSEKGSVVTNGMSYCARDGSNANSALLVSVTPDDFPGEGVLAGMYWQRDIEQKAYTYCGENYYAISQTVGDFLKKRKSITGKEVKPTYKPGVVFGNIDEVLPKVITDAIRKALPEFDKKLNGFSCNDALLTAPETRSSSPVRILRGIDGMTIIKGIYPAGEGAGYAGGIMSSCIDGMKAAEKIISMVVDDKTE